MNRHPVSVALDRLDEEASAEFRDSLRAQLLFELAAPAAAVDDPPEITVTLFRSTGQRRSGLLRVAAAILAIAAAAVALVSRGPEPPGVDTSRDSAIANAALLTPDMVDQQWTGVTHTFDTFTSRRAADLAATVPECARYVDYAFDSPRRDAATAGGVLFSDARAYLFQWVYVFPTEEAASRVMDMISEPSFLACFNGFSEASYPVLVPGHTATMTTVAAPSIAPHGDRQVVFDTHSTGELFPIFSDLSVEYVNVFVQVGRGIVYVNPIRDFHNGLDAHGPVEIAVSAAVNALTDALAARPAG
jgi:hypothetical protein